MCGEAKVNAVIIGSGIFGMSTALWMLEDGGYDVTVLDKCGILPAPDAASTGQWSPVLVTKADGEYRSEQGKLCIIRAGDYADPDLARLAVDAVEIWKRPEWEGTYHESGVIALSAENSHEGHRFVSSAYRNCKSLGIDAVVVPDSSTIKAQFPAITPTGSFGTRQGYSNPIGGWAEAGRAVEVGIKRVRQMGGTVRSGCEVVGLAKGGEGRKVEAVVLKSGEEVKADVVVCAAGAWTPALFASPGISARLPPIQATGQSLGTVQLTQDEVETYAKVPVVFNLDDGFYVFPPNPTGLVKFAIHAAGYTNPTPISPSNPVSVPRTKLTPGAEDGMIPLKMLQDLRRGLGEIYPELAKKAFVSTRLCWYCDTVSGDWLIDYHPDFDNLVLATGGSGHAFKYAPIIGREILKVVKRNPSPKYANRWSFGYDGGDAGADVRVGKVKVLKVEDLARAEDLRAPIGIAA